MCVHVTVHTHAHKGLEISVRGGFFSSETLPNVKAWDNAHKDTRLTHTMG